MRLHFLIRSAERPKVYAPHPVIVPEDICRRTQDVWDRFYSVAAIWQRSDCVRSIRLAIRVVT